VDEDPQIPGVEGDTRIEVNRIAGMDDGDEDRTTTNTPHITVEGGEGRDPTQANSAEPSLIRRSARTKTQPKAYIPSMSGSRYSYAVTQLESEGVLNLDAHIFMQRDFYQGEPDVVTAIMTQLSLKSGLKEWGERAYEAAESEIKQLHFRNTFQPLHWKQLTDTQRKMLESHMFLKQKRDGKIKGRTVAEGNKQRDYISKEDASSPTVTTESVLLTCIIDAEEGHLNSFVVSFVVYSVVMDPLMFGFST
jgi:hypothetical protein